MFESCFIFHTTTQKNRIRFMRYYKYVLDNVVLKKTMVKLLRKIQILTL